MVDKFKYSVNFTLKGMNDLFSIPNGIVDSLFSTARWTEDRLENLRTILNDCKSQTSQFPLHQWEQHTEFTEISSGIKWEIVKRLSNKPPILTRAWIKFYEIISCFDLFDKSNGGQENIQALFLCEAPGGFVNATNHYLKNNCRNSKFNWVANTLNPYYETIDCGANVLDDRFIQNVSVYNNWYFGPSNRGDILEQDFVGKKFHHQYKLLEFDDGTLFDFVTGDGAFDCMSCPERQEEMVFKLILKEVLIGMKLLKNNGSLVVKFFTFFSCETISLLYFICNCFGQVTCFKPGSSKQGNSEIYLVCLNFERNTYNRLKPHFEDISAEQFILNCNLIPKDFIERIYEFSQQISTRQQKAIWGNVNLFDTRSYHTDKQIRTSKYTMAQYFMKEFKIFSIPSNEQLVFDERDFTTNNFYSKFVQLFQKFNLELCLVEPNLFCNSLLRVVNSLINKIDTSIRFINTKSLFNSNVQLKLVYGTPYQQINNSKFCCFYILKSILILKQITQFKSIPQSCLFDDKLIILLRQMSIDYSFYWYDDKTLFSDYLELNLANLTDKINFVSSDCPPNDTYNDTVKFHLFDFYDLSECISSNDFSLCHKFKSKFNSLIVNNAICQNDILIVRFKILISRLSVGLVYVLSKMFKSFTIFSQFNPKVDCIYSSLICVFSQFVSAPKQFESIFTIDQHWTENLLELVPSPVILSDCDFNGLIFNANCLALLNCIQKQVQN